MAEIDEQRIAELAKEPSRVVQGGDESAALEEARKVMGWQALTNREERPSSHLEADPG
ncbi:hypothetical protein [Streptomyces sp. NPDC059455]|uniref:hypothetical protein n=1 Tax=Streptomyces sp. NPDC059455 TaxID=3346837 RepID=UPI0036B3E58D